MMESLLLKAVSTFILSLGLTGLVLPKLEIIALRIGLVDIPNWRKIHNTPKPLIGGIAMLTGVILSSLMFLPLADLRGYLLGLIILLLVGFLDDFRELNHRLKFVAQFLAVGIMVFVSGARLETFGEVLPGLSIHLDYLAVPITFFSAIGLVNAVNMADGIDGLAGGLSLIAFAAFAFLANLNGQPVLMLLSLAFCGALIIFLRHNWHPSSLFMGDAGSLSLGFTLAYIGIMLSQGGQGLVPPAAVLLILAMPVTDTLTVMTKRMIRKRSPFRADKTHFHHLLLRFGFTKRLSAFTILMIALILSFVGIFGAVMKAPHYYLVTAFLIYFAVYILFVFQATKILRVKLKITKGRSHPSSGVSLGIAKLLEGAERSVKIRWEGYQYKVRTPMPCLLSRGKEHFAGTIRSLSTNGFDATSCKPLSLGEVINVHLRLKDQEINLCIPAKVLRVQNLDNKQEYKFSFEKKNKRDTKEITDFLDDSHNRTGDFRPPHLQGQQSKKRLITSPKTT